MGKVIPVKDSYFFRACLMLVPRLNQKAVLVDLSWWGCLQHQALPAAEAARSCRLSEIDTFCLCLAWGASCAGGDVQAQDPVGATKSVREAPTAVLAEPFVSEQAEAIGREPEAVQESLPKDGCLQAVL